MDENAVTGDVISAAIEVHRHLGPGLLESVYEEALAFELNSRGRTVERQTVIPVFYKGVALKGELRLDLLIGDAVIVEVKSIERILPVHEAQRLSYLRLSGKPLGLLLNFNAPTMREGLRRIINSRPSALSAPLR